MACAVGGTGARSRSFSFVSILVDIALFKRGKRKVADDQFSTP